MVMDWGAVLAEHRRWLRTVVLARVKEPQAVDEVMQEVAVAAVGHRVSIVDPQTVVRWLYRVAVIQSIRYRRACARRRGRLTRFAEQAGSNGQSHAGQAAVDPLRVLIARERRQLVADAIQRLPGRDAEILLLKYTESWSLHDLAERLGISPSAVDGRLRRARERLRGELERLSLGKDTP